MPWNTRDWTAAEQKRLRDIADLHVLTLALARELSIPIAVPSTLARLSEARKLDSTLLEALLDDRQASELLADLRAEVLDYHFTLFEELLKKRHAAFGERKILNAAWDEGRAAAASRWPAFLPQESRDLRELLLALSDSAVEPVLLRRGTATEVDLELIHCPHSDHPALGDCSRLNGPSLDFLCQLHRTYRQGFIQALNPRVRFASARANQACSQALRLSPPGPN